MDTMRHGQEGMCTAGLALLISKAFGGGSFVSTTTARGLESLAELENLI